MGTAASMQEVSEIRTTYAEEKPGSSSAHVISNPIIKTALLNKDLSDGKLRRLRAAALGRKSACVVEVTKIGFSLQHIRICEGQVISFKWNSSDSQQFNVVQVVHDGEKHRPVVGGYTSGAATVKGYFEQQFNLAGDYKFTIEGMKISPLVIEVHPRKDIEATLSDDGFEPAIIRLDEGNSITWTWKDCQLPHSVVEATFDLKTCILTQLKSRFVPTRNGSFKREFNKPGLFYFQSESHYSQSRKNTCIVHVRERQREYKINVGDDCYTPNILVIEEGDRVWWEWSAGLNRKYHCIFQTENRKTDNDEEYKPVKDGFAWEKPTKNGLISKEFFKAGIYFYCDREFGKIANYVGTIIVKPAVVDHFIEINKKGFVPDLHHALTCDRVWLTWLTDSLSEDEKVNGVKKFVYELDRVVGLETVKVDQEELGRAFEDPELEPQKFEVGLELAQTGQVGVYHYHNPLTEKTCSIICQGGPKNHTVHVNDGAFQPSVVSIYPGDRVWWVWQEGRKAHNITQVSHCGKSIEGGFSSGATLPCPSSFMHQFDKPGLYYYKSDGIGKPFGAVIVKSRSKVHEVEVSPTSFEPDPLIANVNDVVAWKYPSPTAYEVQEVHSMDDIINAQMVPQGVLPRRCMGKLFPDLGVFHHASRSFATPGTTEEHMHDHRLSTVIISDPDDSATVRLDSEGFHPPELMVEKGKSILWDWKDCDVPQNIVHVDENGEPLKEDEDEKAFNSGDPVPAGTFLYSFEEPGVYTVVSPSGAPGLIGKINVVDPASKTPTPEIISKSNGGTVEKGHVVGLSCANPKSTIYYTTNGSLPSLHRKSTKLYDPSKGIVLSKSGLVFIRAVAVAPECANSDVFTSEKFWVQSGNVEEDNRLSPEQDEEDALSFKQNKHPELDNWEKFVPEIKASFAQPGIMEVYWNAPPDGIKNSLDGYQLFLNGVTYCQMLRPRHTSATVSGLAGGRTYDVYLEAYSKNPSLKLRKSNNLSMMCDKVVSPNGGPLISLETTSKPDSMSIVWQSLNTNDNPIDGYRVYLNGHMCGSMIVPDSSSDRCRVVIDGCKVDQPYTIAVAALPPGSAPPKMSNQLEVILPLRTDDISLPEQKVGDADDGLYSEFVKLREDPANEAEMQNRKSKPAANVSVVVRDDEPSNGGIPPPLDDNSTSTTVMNASLPVPGEDDVLPVAIVGVQKQTDDSALVSWRFPRTAEPLYHLLVNVVNVVGKKFKSNVNSDISFECMTDDGAGASPAVQHSWNMTNGNSVLVKGLAPGSTYSIHVVSTYGLANARQPCEIQTKSPPLKYTTEDNTQPLKIKVLELQPNQVTFEWDKGTEPDPNIVGYRLLANGEQIGKDLDCNMRQVSIGDLKPGTNVNVAISPILKPGSVDPVEPSAPIKVTCPKKPPAPCVKEQPSYKKGSVIVAWENPGNSECTSQSGNDIIFYRVYLDGKLHGEVVANSNCNKNGYQYYLTDLKPGQSYEVSIKACAGQSNIDPNSDQVCCLCESDQSNVIPLVCPAPPKSPHLRIEGMSPSGVDVTWEMPQQLGDAAISGYQMVKDGKLYGSVIPPDVNSLRLKGLTLGEKLDLQILALTDHAVGRGDGQQEDERDSGVGTSSHHDKGPSEVYLGDRYSDCKPGPKLIVHYTGLVQPPSKVWCEKVTGHSAWIAWSRDEDKPKLHYVSPESYQVTWWPGDKPVSDINSLSTKDDHIIVTGLQPNSLYTFVVEARRMQKYADIDEAEGIPNDGYDNTFIMAAQSEHLCLKTASPPDCASNLGVAATTCNSIQVSWDQPKERGVEIIGFRVDAIAMSGKEKKSHTCVEVAPNVTSAKLENLCEKTEYLISVTAVTAEYFDNLPDGHEQKKFRTLSKSIPAPEDPWLPSSNMIASTSGTEQPTDIRVVKTTPDSVTLGWNPARVLGSNRLLGTVVRWMEVKPGSHGNQDTALAHHKTIPAETDGVTIDGLNVGQMYKFVVEAVVSIKTTLDPSNRSDPETERQNRRTTHVLSKPVLARTRAPCEPPKPIITGFTTNTVQLYWEKPSMHLIAGKDDEGNPKHLKLALQGYRLEINGKPHMRLSPAAQSCTLIKCKPGKTYEVVLVALTCTADFDRQRRKEKKSTSTISSCEQPANEEWKPLPEDFENDESPSEQLLATLPTIGDGLLEENIAKYIPPTDKMNPDEEKKDLGNVLVKWSTQGDTSNIRQYNVTWKNLVDGTVQHNCLDPDVTKCTLPATKRKAIYDIVVEPQYHKEVVAPHMQHIKAMIPGSPDQPDIWAKVIEDREFIIEWTEPRLYGGKISGYQIYVNGKKAGNVLSAHHRKAVIPCKPKRLYKVNLVAISSDPKLGDSEMSSTVMVNTGPSVQPTVDSAQVTDGDEDFRAMSDDNELKLRVIRVDEASIHLDWTEYQEAAGIIYYRVVWSSAAQPAEREVKLPAGEKSCVLHKCFPGTSHYVRVYAIGEDDRILDRSRQLTVQTSAAPDPPTVSQRAVNFNYITIEWNKPATFGDAFITGYKIYINGVVEATLGPEESTYSFAGGQWCREYVFQVQALTTLDKLVSRPSDPLVLTWPGVMPPTIQQLPAVKRNTVNVTWDDPYLTENVKIKHYKLVVLEEDTKKPVEIIGPIYPDCREIEVNNLRQSSYLAYLEVHIHGTPEIVKSEFLLLQPVITPDPPVITASILGLEERRALEKKACDLVNQRDRLLSLVYKDPTSSSSSTLHINPETVKASYMLLRMDEMLNECLDLISSEYTGHVHVHISWTCHQTNPELQVAGYRLLVDGKQYGSMLHAGVRSIRIKLACNQKSHDISVLTVSERPPSTSAPSNIVEVITEPFQPFAFYSFFSQAIRRDRAESYEETLAIERKYSSKKPVHQGLLKRYVPAPTCTPIDIFDGQSKPLVSSAFGQPVLTVIFFWSRWSTVSLKTLGWVHQFMKSCNYDCSFVTVACESVRISNSSLQELVKIVTDNGYQEGSRIRHVTSTCSANNRANEASFSTDMSELFNVSGVPTFVVIHPNNYVAWRGRYCAFDYMAFENFMTYILAQVMGQDLPDLDPWNVHIDESYAGLKKRRDPGRDPPIQQQNVPAIQAANGHWARPTSGRRAILQSAKKQRKEEITVNSRPFSASRSPYDERLALTTSQRPSKHGRKAKSTF